MAKDLQTLIQDLKNLESIVRDALPDIAILVTLSAKAISERNIKKVGFGKMYSNNKIPAFFLTGKELNAIGERFIKAKEEAEEETNWKGLRAAQGLQVGHVDLSYENFMWSNMQPSQPEIEGDIVSAPLAATNRESQNKMNWNRDRYGDFIGLSLSKDDYQLLFDIVMEEILKSIKKAGFTNE